MTKLKKEHLPALLHEIKLALQEGIITVLEAKSFSDDVFQAALDEQGKGRPRMSKAAPQLSPESYQRAEGR